MDSSLIVLIVCVLCFAEWEWGAFIGCFGCGYNEVVLNELAAFDRA